MATLNFSIPDSRVQDVAEAFGYQQTLPDGSDNPETKGVFIKRNLTEYVKVRTTEYLRAKAASQVVVNEINIT